MSASLNRRHFLAMLAAGAASAGLPTGALAGAAAPHTAAIPSTGQKIPVIGMGTWITFNVGEDVKLRRQRAEILRTFFRFGGGVIDSSPMYGSAQEVVGWCLDRLDHPDGAFAADKIWTRDGGETRAQFGATRRKWSLEQDTFELMQVHNLLSFEEHWETLRALKQAREVCHLGVTTSHGRRHSELERILKTAKDLDVVQLTYNATHRAVESRLLPLAKERGVAVIANRPFDGGNLVEMCQRHPVPEWAAEIECANWPQILLKWIISHPAVTCAIPATSKVAHMRENMGAGFGAMPDAAFRERIRRHIEHL